MPRRMVNRNERSPKRRRYQCRYRDRNQWAASLLDQIVEQGRFGEETAQKERGKDLIKEFLAQVMQGEVTVSRDTEVMINARIAQIDHLVSLQLNEVLHNAAFQKLEGTWRGLKYVLDNSEMHADAEDSHYERFEARRSEGSATRP